MFDYDPYEELNKLTPLPSFTLTSTDVTHNHPLPLAQRGQGAGGNDSSPQLSWSGFPTNTQSFALTVFDPDAPTGSGFWHWAVYNIPATTTLLATSAGAPNSPLLPAEATTLPNERRLKHYSGATPPDGTGTHRYMFVIHAVDVPQLRIDPEATPAILGINLRTHALARAQLVPTAAYGD